MNKNLYNVIMNRIKFHNMKYAAMDWDKKWYAFDNEPNWKDGSWDVKKGKVIRLYLDEHEYIDNRLSLISL